MHIEQFDPLTDIQHLQACRRMMEAARPIDHPSLPPQSFEGFASWWVHGGGSQQSWLARDDSGEPVGCYLLTLPDRENTTMAGCGLVVTPDRRRAGYGTALLAHCAERARRASRSRLASTNATRTKVRDGSAGAAFAAARGAHSGLAEVIRTQDINADLLAGLASLRADARQRSSDYELLSWLGTIPDEHIDQVTRVISALSDAPRDSCVQPQTRDAARVRKSEEIAAAHGMRLYSVAARHRANGDFAALTQITTDPGTPGWGIQQITAVLPEHRGHRLGMLMKIAMLELAIGHEPGLRRILTGNAESNEHMTAINTRLGYTISDVYRSWDIRLASAGSVP